jgi:hypothetical protein
VETIKRASTIIILTLFLAGPFIVPELGYSSAANLHESLGSAVPNSTNSLLTGLSTDRTFRVAIYNETNGTKPVYAGAGSFFNNNHTFTFDILQAAGYEVTYITATDILEHQLTTASFDVLVLDGNYPRESIVNDIKEFWLAGGGILSITSSCRYLAYAGILPEETGGVSDGAGVYWGTSPYDDANLTVRNPITQAYPSGGQILDEVPTYTGSSAEYYYWNKMMTTSIAADLTKIAVATYNGTLALALSLDPSAGGGRVLQVGIPTWYPFLTQYLSDWAAIISDSVGWLAPMPKARIAFDLSHMPFYGIDPWDSLANESPHYALWRDLIVAEGYTVDKFYPSTEGNLTANRLAAYDIFVEVLPAINFTTPEVEAVQTWVANGHGLLAMGDHPGLKGNGNINHLMMSLPLNINKTTYGVGPYDVANQNHPTTEHVTAVNFATPGLVDYSDGVVPLVGSAVDQTIVAAYQYMDGRIVLIADIDWMIDAILLTDNNQQFSSNVIDWLSVGNGDVLIYVDSPFAANFFKTPLALALNQLGLHFYLTSNSTYTNISLWYQEWSLVVIAESNYDVSSIYSSLKQYIDQGGRVLMEAWNLDAYPNSPLWATLGAKFVQDWQWHAPVYIWQSENPIFNVPVHYNASTLNMTAFADEGDRVRVFDNATALAGNSTVPSENGSAIVLRNDGQTLLNTFTIDGLLGDADDSAYLDAFEIWMNEVAFMLGPSIDSPSDIAYEAGSTGHTITWSPNSGTPATFEVDVNGTMEQSGPWDGSSVTYSVDGLDPGTYFVRLTVLDTRGEQAQDTVLVTVQDTTLPTLVGPADFTTSGTVKVRWNASDLYPASWKLFVNGTQKDSGTWTGNHVDVSVSSLDPGVYNFTLSVTDESGNTATDTVIVTVTAAGLFGFDTTTVIVIGLGLLLLIIIIAAVLSRRKSSKKPAPKPKKK